MRKYLGYWNEETVISELKLVIKRLGHFPTRNELNELNKRGLTTAISRHGGFRYFREKLGHKLIKKHNGYWNDCKVIITELELVIEKLGHFPTQRELINIDRGDLATSILKNGGYNHFREKLGHEPIKKSKGFWDDVSIVDELKSIIEILGHFPTESELKNMKRGNLAGGINKGGGYPKFQKLLGYKSMKPDAYWIEGTIINELSLITEKLSHFPSQTELNKMKKSDLSNAIATNGGIVHFRELLGFSVSLHEKYRSELMSYIGKRGKRSEELIKEIIIDWSIIHNKPSPDFNVKLAPGNVLEFICDFDKKVGIDVTNTKASISATVANISRKWKHKDYRFYLDELWIVVFTNILSSENYNELNIRSPEDVKVFSIDDFLNELDYSTGLCDTEKISKFKNCTFHNKDEMININKPVQKLYI